MAAFQRRKYLIGSAAFLVFAGLGLWALFLSQHRPGLIDKPFKLTDAEGRIFDSRELQGKPSLVYFGFTHCPDICPTTLFLLAQVLKKLGPDAARINALFITVDPDRDTPEQLKASLAAYDPHLRGLTGDPAQLAALRVIYGIDARILAGTGRNYNIDHTNTVFVLDRGGRVRSSFDLHASSDEVVALLEALMQGR
ncbi:SCO family protein [Labrys sp. LIt4]|uniref:SCO family protein n=1 Tax=Labrys sp. LIt4 TaxID=2821355 RepID=UPI001ADF3427|nr:SCO family protein [Labrys sp. LIt4]